ncbi:MAG: YggS family pyridoxal phosphate-dependent enzyme [Planctomycetes bacterium]|nr:YggS family pyridoxal phosphate-dependent enzyme [Planctomycetota bacterium]
MRPAPVDDAPLSDAARAALARNLAALRGRVAAACARVGRDPASVALVAVTKYTGAHVARALVDLGQRDLGENRADRVEALAGALADAAPRWHMVGHLQRNKARLVAGHLFALHSLDSLDLARKLDALRPAALPPLEVYVEVRLGDGEGRSGLDEAALPAFLAGLEGLSRLRLAGLMGLPPEGTPEEARPHFQRLRRLRDQHLPGGGLSMGMTNDLEVAVEEGATVVRVGRALIEGLSSAG